MARIYSVSLEWASSTFSAIEAAGGATIGLALAYSGHKVLLGSMKPGEWHAVLEFEDEDGGFACIEAIGKDPIAALDEVVQEAEDEGVEPQC